MFPVTRHHLSHCLQIFDYQSAAYFESTEKTTTVKEADPIAKSKLVRN